VSTARLLREGEELLRRIDERDAARRKLAREFEVVEVLEGVDSDGCRRIRTERVKRRARR
jgi:hypothetical protein